MAGPHMSGRPGVTWSDVKRGAARLLVHSDAIITDKLSILRAFTFFARVCLNDNLFSSLQVHHQVTVRLLFSWTTSLRTAYDSSDNPKRL